MIGLCDVTRKERERSESEGIWDTVALIVRWAFHCVKPTDSNECWLWPFNRRAFLSWIWKGTHTHTHTHTHIEARTHTCILSIPLALSQLHVYCIPISLSLTHTLQAISSCFYLSHITRGVEVGDIPGPMHWYSGGEGTGRGVQSTVDGFIHFISNSPTALNVHQNMLVCVCVYVYVCEHDISSREQMRDGESFNSTLVPTHSNTINLLSY